jgi:hypothetical protein
MFLSPPADGKPCCYRVRGSSVCILHRASILNPALEGACQREPLAAQPHVLESSVKIALGHFLGCEECVEHKFLGGVLLYVEQSLFHVLGPANLDVVCETDDVHMPVVSRAERRHVDNNALKPRQAPDGLAWRRRAIRKLLAQRSLRRRMPMRAKILNARSTIFTPTPRAARGINISQEIVDPSGTRCKPHKPHNGKRFEVIVKLETALRTSTDTLLENHNNRHVQQTARLLATTAPGKPLLRSRLPFGVKNGPDALEMGCLYYPRRQTIGQLRGKSQAWLIENQK